jgi:hypothetical protein
MWKHSTYAQVSVFKDGGFTAEDVAVLVDAYSAACSKVFDGDSNAKCVHYTFV